MQQIVFSYSSAWLWNQNSRWALFSMSTPKWAWWLENESDVAYELTLHYLGCTMLNKRRMGSKYMYLNAVQGSNFWWGLQIEKRQITCVCGFFHEDLFFFMDSFSFLYQNTFESEMQIGLLIRFFLRKVPTLPHFIKHSSVLWARHAAANKLSPVFLHW